MSFYARNTPRKDNYKGYRVIKTARNLDAINTAIKEGFIPLIKRVEPSEEIQSKYALFKNNETNEIELVVDARAVHRKDKDPNYSKIIDTTFYYPYNFESPFAAYLIPPDLKKGDLVYVEDLIEDLIGFKWNQRVTRRLKSCEARWNGEDLEILYDPSKIKRIMG